MAALAGRSRDWQSTYSGGRIATCCRSATRWSPLHSSSGWSGGNPSIRRCSAQTMSCRELSAPGISSKPFASSSRRTEYKARIELMNGQKLKSWFQEFIENGKQDFTTVASTKLETGKNRGLRG